MTVAVSGHELLKTRICAARNCEDDGEVEVGGDWFCNLHAPARRNGSAKRTDLASAKGAEPGPETTPPVAAAEPGPEEPPKCAKCDEPGITRYGRSMLCEAHDRERRDKTRQTLRKRTEALRLAASPPIPGGLEERLGPALRLADETQAAYEEAREALRRAIDEVFS